jgi:hypothetical protein
LFFRTSLVTNYVTNKIYGSCLLFVSFFIADLCMVKNVDMYILCSNLYVCPLCGTWDFAFECEVVCRWNVEVHTV